MRGGFDGPPLFPENCPPNPFSLSEVEGHGNYIGHGPDLASALGLRLGSG